MKNLDATESEKPVLCKESDCNAPARVRDWCLKCYTREAGKPTFVRLTSEEKRQRHAAPVSTGERFERWTVIGQGKWQGQMRYMVCRCDCGTVREVRSSGLQYGSSKSCGCLTRDVARQRTTHGMTRSPEHHAWNNMHSRCLDSQPEHAKKNYRDRGICVCEGYRQFSVFYADVKDRPSPGHSIDRKNNDGGYSCGKCPQCISNGWPMNIRWATKKEQCRNQRNNRMLTLNGETLCAADWAERLSIPYACIGSRLRRGWSDEETLTRPTQNSQKGLQQKKAA